MKKVHVLFLGLTFCTGIAFAQQPPMEVLEDDVPTVKKTTIDICIEKLASERVSVDGENGRSFKQHVYASAYDAKMALETIIVDSVDDSFDPAWILCKKVGVALSNADLQAANERIVSSRKSAKNEKEYDKSDQ